MEEKIGCARCCHGAKEAASSILSLEEPTCRALHKHTLLALDDCLYAFESSIPKLTCSSLRRVFVCHGISRLPEVKDDK